jgi:predicted site-specific integrase-resolvase
MSDKQQDTVIYRADLCKRLGVGSEAMRRWLKAGKLPKPDVDISQKTRGWKMSTLRAAGIDLV